MSNSMPTLFSCLIHLYTHPIAVPTQSFCPILMPTLLPWPPIYMPTSSLCQPHIHVHLISMPITSMPIPSPYPSHLYVRPIFMLNAHPMSRPAPFPCPLQCHAPLTSTLPISIPTPSPCPPHPLIPDTHSQPPSYLQLPRHAHPWFKNLSLKMVLSMGFRIGMEWRKDKYSDGSEAGDEKYYLFVVCIIHTLVFQIPFI